jgi:hypothetical protein
MNLFRLVRAFFAVDVKDFPLGGDSLRKFAAANFMIVMRASVD